MRKSPPALVACLAWLCLGGLAVPAEAEAQASTQAAAPGSEAPSFFLPSSFLPRGGELGIVEKSNYHRYVDGRNAGFVYRESRGALSASSSQSGILGYSGELFILEEIYRDSGITSRRVDRSEALDLSVGEGASFSVDRGFPSLRGMLSGAPAELAPGRTWIAQAAIALDPHNTGDFVILPVLVEYLVSGPASYAGRDAILVKGKFAVRSGAFPGSARPAQRSAVPSQALVSVSGTHDLDISIDAQDGSVLLIRDRFDESFTFPGSPPERHTGFSFIFFRGGSLADRARIASSLGAKAEGPAPPASAVLSGKAPSQAAPAPAPAAAPPAAAPAAASPVHEEPAALSSAGPGPLLSGEELALDESSPLASAGVELLDSPEGIVLRVKDLRFVADSDEILASEKWRLDAIAASLAGIAEGSFLVEGHSASVGKPKGELELSGLRAKRVVDELVARGIAANRFIYRGLGSGHPIAENSTEAGRARNRRVEITILR